MFIEEYPIDTQHTTNTGKHTATIELVEGVYTVNYEIDDTADVQAEFKTLQDARDYIDQNY